MILIFDLDDTLYDEMSYVTSGLRAVAHFGEASFGWDAAQSLAFMQAHLLQHGRGKVFDAWLHTHGQHSNTRVTTCVRTYRHHQPEITLFPLAYKVLKYYIGGWPLYLVTDGHKVVQQKKIEALGLAPMFKRTFITHRFGIRHAKPSLHCFEIIRRAERCEWCDMVYVGDNPAKDFVGLNRVGAMTVRVNTGSHASVVARPGYDARTTIPDLASLPEVLGQ
ncbi:MULTISPECIES: HAD family hydrolase [unclassified Ectothiorhodospira]|uniref:HAD family hydrolase n=1 Tax=unclassified Ectothiorhodospira TaxID=2684909 RepID=UPI001EE9131A|nr:MULTISPECIES: HAD family hydrolase [unclassified Ectothiorhodospira]MCG5516522.1 HAD family hydrolase [Ectothiorhodospira sp. 9100]MCG5519279.1 HAD family hydrolase [Ectothiorhodospira sp. 9905]